MISHLTRTRKLSKYSWELDLRTCGSPAWAQFEGLQTVVLFPGDDMQLDFAVRKRERTPAGAALRGHLRLQRNQSRWSTARTNLRLLGCCHFH